MSATRLRQWPQCRPLCSQIVALHQAYMPMSLCMLPAFIPGQMMVGAPPLLTGACHSSLTCALVAWSELIDLGVFGANLLLHMFTSFPGFLQEFDQRSRFHGALQASSLSQNNEVVPTRLVYEPFFYRLLKFFTALFREKNNPFSTTEPRHPPHIILLTPARGRVFHLFFILVQPMATKVHYELRSWLGYTYIPGSMLHQQGYVIIGWYHAVWNLTWLLHASRDPLLSSDLLLVSS